MIKGIGPVYAKKLVRAFEEKVFDMIEATGITQMVSGRRIRDVLPEPAVTNSDKK